MPSFVISFSVRISTLTPSCLESLRAGGEFDRAEHVGRLVDQVAREHDAVGNGLGVGKGCLGGLPDLSHWMTNFDGFWSAGLPSASSFLVLYLSKA